MEELQKRDIWAGSEPGWGVMIISTNDLITRSDKTDQ